MADREETQRLLNKNEDGVENRRRLSPFCDPNHLLHRVVVLLFMCFLGFGKCFDLNNKRTALLLSPNKVVIVPKSA